MVTISSFSLAFTPDEYNFGSLMQPAKQNVHGVDVQG